MTPTAKRERDGGYLTRGRAAELERRIEQRVAEMEGYFNRRLDELERAIAEVRTIPLESARAQLKAIVDMYRGDHPPPTRKDC